MSGKITAGGFRIEDGIGSRVLLDNGETELITNLSGVFRCNCNNRPTMTTVLTVF